MSKAIGNIFGAGGQASTSMYGSENEILKYLNNYDTTNYDNTLKNLVSYAANASNQLSNMGDYNFSVDGSDAARQRAEQATYQSYLDKLQPQFANQTSDLQASLANKGISIGSEAYSRAMSDLQDSQNAALNQAAYQATLAGQDAFSNSLSDELRSAGFSNAAQTSYINQLLQALQNSYSGYDIAMDKFKVQYGADDRIANNRAANAQSAINFGNDLIKLGISGSQDAASKAASAGAVAAAASDIRLKENITAVGKLDNGLTVYLFNFKGSNVPQIGLIAQEVIKQKPEAIVEDSDGYLSVRYDIACQ